jgi:hypothetical protein
MLFANQQWAELIEVRKRLLAQRRAALETSGAGLRGQTDARIAYEHAKTALGWAQHHAGNAQEARKLYLDALDGLHNLQKEFPSNLSILIRLQKFHSEAAQISEALGLQKQAKKHLRQSEIFASALKNL